MVSILTYQWGMEWFMEPWSCMEDVWMFGFVFDKIDCKKS